MSTTVQTATDVRPFQIEIPEEKLAELRRRVTATRWPQKSSSMTTPREFSRG